MIVEGHENPGGEPPRRAEGDLLAERRARRATDSGEAALVRRAEAAEATVQTLERHVASLQQRLREADEERRSTARLIDEQRRALEEHEHELRVLEQREYAEQQLRVEAEERLIGSERESLAEIERLTGRLSARESEARGLAERLESVERQLSEAEHAAAAERASLGRGEQRVFERLGRLERAAEELRGALEGERAARERIEGVLLGMRDGYRQLGALLGELKAIVARLIPALSPARAAAGERPLAARVPAAPATAALEPVGPPQAQPLLTGEARQASAPSVEMAEALAAAVERLRRRAQDAGDPACEPARGPSAPASQPGREAPAPAFGVGWEASASASPALQHKHSSSLIGRLRRRRKERRAR